VEFLGCAAVDRRPRRLSREGAVQAILLEVLRCPRCRGELACGDGLALRCARCDAGYPVVDGVPRMCVDDGLVEDTRRGFDYQWRLRQRGRGEHRDTVYAYDIRKFMRWLSGFFAVDVERQEPGRWLLDAGCGSGEKARELALRFTDRQVVAVDQSPSVSATARENADLLNLHFVEANLLHPPFRERSFAFAMSIGVLHHTPSTERAFAAVAALVAPQGGLLTWIYPLPEEDSFWAGLYRQRDQHFRGLGHRLPRPLVLMLCHFYVTLLFPFILGFLKREYRRNRDRMPIYPDRFTLRGTYRSSVFLSFDNVMPRYQFRHGCGEVKGWYCQEGFGAVNDEFPGFFYAVRSLVSE
jgi:SAM-dependent methyltransferase